jgi:hypothetical protein
MDRLRRKNKIIFYKALKEFMIKENITNSFIKNFNLNTARDMRNSYLEKEYINPFSYFCDILEGKMKGISTIGGIYAVRPINFFRYAFHWDSTNERYNFWDNINAKWCNFYLQKNKNAKDLY